MEDPALSSAPAQSFAVLAAGTLCWRVQKKQLWVLLIHRPRYDDWSWPKGKQDPGETLPETAIREVDEEIGVKVSLGIPLPHTDYPVSSGLKLVYYWACELVDQKPAPDRKEVDDVLWCTPDRARQLLSNSTDIKPLDALEEAHRRKELRTWPLIILRHAKAKPRSSWTRAEGDRPLAATGQRQAAAVKRLMFAWRPDRIVSSPWVRCIATISPYAKASEAKVKLVDALTEANHQRKPAKTAAVVDTLFDKERAVLLCTHRPALPSVFKQLARYMSPKLRALLPVDDPYLAPGELVVCQIAGNRVVSLEQHKPFED
ncbi:putative phosphatase [Renibacterium salmoninarum ATCC 33209]|uniref:Putative phosphatase n=1 Tax=Renibacterium salmoninarum (strain ATCC 33209 / DSM 20767 / JCM 11484 / NBRC 15589 / NCIMB 2235) TaxID=288705 RepID=A9WNI3_RENSM|nr:NUDIX hydrolase [Renibacterium salmoninarum]ABY22705.1 putative phosphatase [Renibacterium salmoninarum ATCC 33209]